MDRILEIILLFTGKITVNKENKQLKTVIIGLNQRIDCS